MLRGINTCAKINILQLCLFATSDAKRSIAGLAVLAHLFEKCKVFEKEYEIIFDREKFLVQITDLLCNCR